MKLIAMSGSSRENLKAARELGATVTLAKPFSIEALKAAVRRLVGESSQG